MRVERAGPDGEHDCPPILVRFGADACLRSERDGADWVMALSVSAARELAGKIREITRTLPRDPLTAREADALGVIERYRDKRGCSPTTREIAEAMGVSDERARRLCRGLRKKGWLYGERHRHRSLRIAGTVETVETDHDDDETSGGPLQRPPSAEAVCAERE